MLLLSLELILKIISIILPLLIAIAYFTLAERKIMAAIQRRKGPNVVGFLGLLQPLADGLKLILKETTVPSNANKVLFNIAPILTFFLSLLGWAVVPFGKGIVLSDLNLGLMYIFAISSLGVYGVIIAGWASNSKYAFLGALRSAAQMISYELSMGFIIINIVILAGSFNLSDIIESQDYIWYAIPQLPMFCMFFVCALAETNRHPFDLMEAEAELVSGFNVEYAAAGFAMFFLGEYGNILLMCSLISILFLGGYKAPIFLLSFIPGPIWFGIKIVFFVILFIWVRAAYPRYRYDQLMRLGWKIFLPLSLGYLIFTTGIHTSFFTGLPSSFIFTSNFFNVSETTLNLFSTLKQEYYDFQLFANAYAEYHTKVNLLDFLKIDCKDARGAIAYMSLYFNESQRAEHWHTFLNVMQTNPLNAMVFYTDATTFFIEYVENNCAQFETIYNYFYNHSYNEFVTYFSALEHEMFSILNIEDVSPNMAEKLLPVPETNKEEFIEYVSTRLSHKDYVATYFQQDELVEKTYKFVLKSL